MSSRISVKVSTVKMIKALTDKATKLRVEIEGNRVDEVLYERAHAKWEKAILEAMGISSTLKNPPKIDVRVHSYSNNIILDFSAAGINLPEEPVNPSIKIYTYGNRSIKTAEEKIEEIENAVRMLKMTDEKTVNTTTFKAISQYL